MNRIHFLVISLLLIFSFAGVAQTPAASVVTDKSAYTPGDVVNILGQNWKPAEALTIVVHENPTVDADTTLMSAAQQDGTFTNSAYTVQQHQTAINYTVTVTGGASGALATAQFVVPAGTPAQ
jgi:hypothetical protein